MLTVKDLTEAADGFLKGNVASLHACELLCNREGLREETLDLSCTVNNELILLGELLHTHNRDYVLKLLVSLENLLYVARYLIVLNADKNIKVELIGEKSYNSDNDVVVETRYNSEGEIIEMFQYVYYF